MWIQDTFTFKKRDEENIIVKHQIFWFEKKSENGSDWFAGLRRYRSSMGKNLYSSTTYYDIMI